jgi:oxygen-independent coproporphyrinogen-3 oxidase
VTNAGEWSAEPGFGVYLHIPFCLHRCHYCDFNTYEGIDELHAPYVNALEREIRELPGEIPEATSVFFGGGTPTLLPPAALARLLAAVRSRVGLAPDAEVTIEANPETVDAGVFEALLRAGANRFSIGIQSLEPIVLERLGRRHSVAIATGAVNAARAAGVADLNVDLIFGSPWETDEAWERTLEAAVELEPDHISAYSLMVEPGTPLATLVATGREPDVDPEVQAARYARADEVLGDADYVRYETSNWARPGRASRHNILYWSAGDYLGLGAGAHGHRSGRRSWAVRLPRDYIARIERGRPAEDGAEILDPSARADEALMLGLRLTSGIDRRGFRVRFGSDPLGGREEVTADLERAGVLRVDEARVSIEPGAAFVANEILARLL